MNPSYNCEYFIRDDVLEAPASAIEMKSCHLAGARKYGHVHYFLVVFPVAFTRKPGAAESCNLSGNSTLCPRQTLMLEKHRDLFDWQLA